MSPSSLRHKEIQRILDDKAFDEWTGDFEPDFLNPKDFQDFDLNAGLVPMDGQESNGLKEVAIKALVLPSAPPMAAYFVPPYSYQHYDIGYHYGGGGDQQPCTSSYQPSWEAPSSSSSFVSPPQPRTSWEAPSFSFSAAAPPRPVAKQTPPPRQLLPQQPRQEKPASYWVDLENRLKSREVLKSRIEGAVVRVLEPGEKSSGSKRRRRS